MFFTRIGQYAAYLVVRVVICIVQATSLETCVTASKWLAWFFCRVLRLRGALVDENLRHAFPELTLPERQQLALRMWEHLFLMPVEIAHAPRKIHDTNWRDYVTLHGQTDLIRALLSDRPVIMVSGHFGNFEIGGFLLGILGFPTSSVARPLDNPYLNRFVNRFRGITGQSIIAKKGGFEDILSVLARNGTMAFLADQYAGSKGCWVEFFKRPASAHKAIALLAMEHQALVCIVAARRADAPMHFEMILDQIADPGDQNAPAGNVREMTQWYTTSLEQLIRKTPDQYWWVHRRWKGKPPVRGKARAAAAA